MEPTIKIQSAKDSETDQYARFSWYGDQGVGKSTLAATIALWIRANFPGKRALVISSPGESIDAYKPYPNEIKVVRIDRWDQLAEILILLRRTKDSGLFCAVIWDTWPSRLAMMKIAGIDLSAEEATDLIRNPHKLTVTPQKGQDGFSLWRDIASLQFTAYISFAELPIHMAVLFQPEEREDKEGEMHVGPALTPQAAQLIRPQLKMCGYLYTKEVESVDLLVPSRRAISENVRERKLLIEKHDLFFAKGPSNKLGAVVTNPTWSRLAQAIGADPLQIEEGED